jgi:hypothetical protein
MENGHQKPDAWERRSPRGVDREGGLKRFPQIELLPWVTIGHSLTVGFAW